MPNIIINGEIATIDQVNESVGQGYHDIVVWDDIIISPATLSGGNTRPDRITLVSNIDAYGFNGDNTTEEMSGTTEIPHDYKEGTDLRPHIHWCPSDTSVGDVKWQLEIAVAGVGETFVLDAIDSVVVASDQVDRKHQVVEFDNVMDGTNFKIGDVIAIRLFRVPSDSEDTYGSDAIFLSLGFHYEIDGDGSRGIFTK